MTLTLIRQPSTDGATMGELYIDGRFSCFCLEPDDDGPHPAIPLGRYPVTITRSARFGRMLPLINDVPGRSGIRIHPGNHAGPPGETDTEGCLLLGTTRSATSVGGSRVACEAVQHEIAGALSQHEPVWLDVELASSERAALA